MKETEEINEKDILVIISKKDADEFKSLANGRKFCKRGERIIDICNEEFERKEYKKLGIFSRIFHKKKFKNKELLLLENRTASSIRMVVKYLLAKEENANISVNELEKQTKKFILDRANEYLNK